MFLLLWKPELLKNNVFYNVFGALEQNMSKNIGFIMFLGGWKSELLKKHLFYNVFGPLEGRIVEKPLVL